MVQRVYFLPSVYQLCNQLDSTLALHSYCHVSTTLSAVG